MRRWCLRNELLLKIKRPTTIQKKILRAAPHMRKLSFATLLSKKKAAGKLSDEVFNSLHKQSCLSNELAPRLKASIASSGSSGSSGLLIFGPQDLFFFLIDERAEVDSALPTEENVMCVIPIGSLCQWSMSDRRSFIVVADDSSVFEFCGHQMRDDLSIWSKEAMSMCDFQVLRHLRESGNKSSSFLFAFLEKEEDLSSVVESEPSLKELASDDTLLFDVRLLNSPDKLSAESVFFAGRRFVARWSVGSRRTVAVIVIVNPNQGLVLLLPLLGVWTCLFFNEISWSHKRTQLTVKHAVASAPVVVHSFSCGFAEQLDEAIKLELDAHNRRDLKQQPLIPMPLLYPPSMPSRSGQRVGGTGSSSSQAEKSKTLMETRKKTVRNQLKTIRKKNVALDQSGADYATSLFLGNEDEK